MTGHRNILHAIVIGAEAFSSKAESVLYLRRKAPAAEVEVLAPCSGVEQAGARSGRLSGRRS